MHVYFLKNKPVRFLDFIDGDFVNSGDGTLEGKNLLLRVRVESTPGSEIYINSFPAVESDKSGVYTATIHISEYRNSVIAENKTENVSSRITLFRLCDSDGKYFRISSDDNILFLKDLTENNYSSIFEHPYLAVYKKAHELYGAKVHLNLFYSFDDDARSQFSSNPSYFDLSMMTDRYKEEFKRNASWLKLAFHAASEYPPRPYEFSSGEDIVRDCVAVNREIVRFAGAECISNSTTVHYGTANVECVRALRALGFRSLTGYFELNKFGKPRVSYYAPAELALHVGSRDFWMDTEEDVVFGRIDSVLNEGTLDDVKTSVQAVVSDLHRGGFVSVMIHEQYFYSDYSRYLPDFEERVLWTCKYLSDNGYKGAHISDITKECQLDDRQRKKDEEF